MEDKPPAHRKGHPFPKSRNAGPRGVCGGQSRPYPRRVAEGADFHAIREQLEHLIEYCNTSYKAVQERFSRKTHPIVIKDPEPVAPLR